MTNSTGTLLLSQKKKKHKKASKKTTYDKQGPNDDVISRILQSTKKNPLTQKKNQFSISMDKKHSICSVQHHRSSECEPMIRKVLTPKIQHPVSMRLVHYSRNTRHENHGSMKKSGDTAQSMNPEVQNQQKMQTYNRKLFNKQENNIQAKKCSKKKNVKQQHNHYSFLSILIATCLVLSMFTGISSSFLQPVSAQDIAGDVEMHLLDSPPYPPEDVSHTIVSKEMLSTSVTANYILNVPTSTWTYGCAATSAGMLFGYYDRTGYANMYTGPANGGICPLSDLGQGDNPANPIPGSCHIIATMNGHDGITSDAHVDDYWIGYGNSGPDPWVTNGVTEHTWSDCTADFLGTNQWKWDFDGDGNDFNIDGGTMLWSYTNSKRLYDYVQPAYLGLPQTSFAHGLRLFAESRGYSLVYNDSINKYEVFTQKTDNVYAEGFSFDDFKDEIDHGRPVFIHVTNHTMIGIGYDESYSPPHIFIHDTWDNSVHDMDWGGSYAGRTMFAVTVLHLESLEEPEIPLVSFYPQANIPDEQVNMTVVNGTKSYFSITLSDVPDGFDVSNDVYVGWCFEQTVQMTRDIPHPVRLCHSFDPDRPEEFKHANWTMINYVINRKDLYPVEDVQDAIWKILDGTFEVTSSVQQIVDEARQYGSSFVPGNGDYIAVLAYLDPDEEPGYADPVQNTFIQIPLMYTACPPGFWQVNTDLWPEGIDPDDVVGEYFDLPRSFDDLESITLIETLGKITTSIPFAHFYIDVLRNATVAMLNANTDGVKYPIRYDQILIMVHDAFPSLTRTMMVALILKAYNLIGCDCSDPLSTCPCCV